MTYKNRGLVSIFGGFARGLTLYGALCISVLGGCKGKDSNHYVDTNTVPNPHSTLFSKTIDDEPGVAEGNFPLMYGIYSNNVNNSSGYADMASILDKLEFFEEPSGFKFDGELHLRIEVNHPSKAQGLVNNGGPSTPDYIGIVSPSNKSGIIDFSGMEDYANRQLTPQEAFDHAGYFFNTSFLPTVLDPLKPPSRITNNFDPLNPSNPFVERVNYGNKTFPQTVQLPTGDVVEAELFVEVAGGKKQVVDFDGVQDRVAIDRFRLQPFFDPATLDASYTNPTTRSSVDSMLFQSVK